MAFKTHASFNYSTHLPCLIKAVGKTTGDILELGTGLFSTPYLHYVAILQNRKLVSYESFLEWGQRFLEYGYVCDNHEINLVEKYADAKIDKPWDLALIDQTPDSSRAETIRRLANLAKYIIVHDSNGNKDKTYHYSTIYSLFKYRTIWDKDKNHATVLSNFVDLEDFWL